MNERLSDLKPACTHPLSSSPNQHLVSWVPKGVNGTVANTLVAVASRRSPAPKLCKKETLISTSPTTTPIEDIREKSKLTNLLAVGKHLRNIPRDGASARACVRIAEDRPRDWSVAGQVGGGVAVAVLHPGRDGGDAGDAGAVDEHVLDLAVDGEGALVELGAAGALDCRENKRLVLGRMLDWSLRLTQCWEAFDDLYDGRHDGCCHSGHRVRHTGQEAWLGGWDRRGHGGEGQTQDAEDGVGDHVGGGELFGLVGVSEWNSIR